MIDAPAVYYHIVCDQKTFTGWGKVLGSCGVYTYTREHGGVSQTKGELPMRCISAIKTHIMSTKAWTEL